MGPLRASWGRPGASWGRLGLSWGRLGLSWGRLGGPVAGLGEVLGRSWVGGEGGGVSRGVLGGV